MKTLAKKPNRSGAPKFGEFTIVYRGIKIAPMSGKRSKVAKTLRNALRKKAEEGLRGHRKSA